MALPRFLVDSLPLAGTVELDADESLHASQVLRLRAEAEIILFDGQGGEALAHIEHITRRTVVARLRHRSDTCRELPLRLEFVVALPKGDRQKVLVDGLVPLGVASLTPLESTRGVAQPTSKAVERLRRGVVEASKQCGRNQLMRIESCLSVAELAAEEPAEQVARCFAHPYGDARPVASIRSGASVEHAAGNPFAPGGALRVAVGPEGGFTEAEVEQLRQHGWQQISLGPRILRVELAAISLAAYFALALE